jgi:hypothetical protein
VDVPTEEISPAAADDVFYYRFTFADARPEPADIEKVLGYPTGQASAPVVAAIQHLFRGSQDLWSIQGGCVVYPSITLDRRRHSVDIQGLNFDVGKVVAGQLTDAKAMAVFVCTAGSGIEQLSRQQMSSGDPVTGFIADTLGSLVVENAMDQVQARLAAAAKDRGLEISERYSPGYCGWQVDEQQKLFRLLPDGFCGVRLTDSSLMQPIKSVSGFIGLGARVTRQPYNCRFCDIGDCLYRKRRSEAGPAADTSVRG